MDKKKKKRKTIILAIILAICTLVNITYYSISEKVYAAAVIPALSVSGDAVLSLLFNAMVCAGIYDSVKTQQELDAMEEDAQNEYLQSIALSKKELLNMLYTEGYFDDTPIADVVAASMESAPTSALDKFLSSVGLEGDCTLMGSNQDPDEDNKIWATLGVTTTLVATLGTHIKTAFKQWIEDKKEEIQGGSGSGSESVKIEAAAPDDWPYFIYKDGSGGIYYTSFRFSSFGSVPVVLYEVSNSYGPRIAADYEKHYKYDIDSASWIYINSTSASYYQYIAQYANGVSKILYNSYSYKEEGSDVVIASKPLKVEETEDITEEEAIENVNKYLESLGFSSRYSLDVADAGEDIYSGTKTHIDNWDVDTDRLLVVDDIISTVKNMVVPISQAIDEGKAAAATFADTLENIKEKAEAGSNAIAASVADEITKDEAEEISGIPISTGWGPMTDYTVNGLDDVFPFCIPFDIYRCIKVLCADAEAPRWEFPFVVQSLGINETIVLDMAKYESVAKICRWVETLIFIYGLAAKTKAYMFT